MQHLIAPLANHMWQSTAFVAAVAVVCLALRNHSPRLRYWLWLAASLKFLVPFSVLVSLGASFDRPQESVPVVQALTVEQLSYAFAPAPPSLAAAETPAAAVAWSTALLCLWAAGFIGIAVWRFRQWRSLYVIRRQAESVSLEFPVPAVEADSLIEPGIFGIVRPVLLLPRGLRGQLTDEQFETLIAHELCHVRYRDNMTAAMHMAVEALFWFYPPIWWIGAKLVAERERACDQSVLAQGGSAEVYAASILNVCRHYLESPLLCASGITGAELKTRIHEIMERRAGRPLSAMRKAALAIAALVAVSIPVAIGLLRPQTLPPPADYMYGVVSVRPSASNEGDSRIDPDSHGGMQVQNVAVIMLMTFAYDVPAERFADVPEWVTTDRFDVGFTPEREEMSFAPVSRSEGISSDQVEGLMSRQRERMQAVLRDRFGLVVRAESRELPFYALTIAKGGSKLTPAAKDGFMRLLGSRGWFTAKGVDLQELTLGMSNQNLLGRPVVDETGLGGRYDVELKWTPDRSMPPLGARGPVGPREPPGGDGGGEGSVFAALTEQLGIKVESRKGPASVLVVEKIEKPEGN
ncbi:MAG: M56 family metallopeptidase [Acidobacteria bacterium]|nr:M56 family metallopeptidase [Acidobacteriota bacterium]MDA1236135.1 M56 family metallopeptidase [Acidobacteriota bacterium]